MPRRTTGRGAGRPVRAAPVGDVEGLLDALDTAMLQGDPGRVAQLSEQLWPARRHVPDAIVRRLVEGRARVPGLAFEMLGGFAGERSETYLRRIAEDPAAPEIVRFGARRRAGWPETGQAKRRRAFLDTLGDADGTLEVAAGQATGGWPPDGEVLGEVLGYLQALPAARRRDVLGRIVAAHGARAAWLLRAALHIADVPLQRQALGALVHLRDGGAAAAIGRLARTARGAALRAEAQAAAQRLQVRPVDAVQGEEILPFPPIGRAYLSQIDGDGGQVVIAVREWGPGLCLFLDVFHNELWGIKHALGAMRLPADQLESMLAEFEEEGLALVEVDIAAARGALAVAVAVNVSTRHAIPPEYELWAPLYHESDPPPADEPVVVPELDDGPYAGRADLVRASERLAEHPWFEAWGFDDEAVVRAMAGAPPPSRRGLTDRHHRMLLGELVDDTLRQTWRYRLRRQAWLLDRAGEPAMRDLALAVAAHLASASPRDLAGQPFLRTLVEQQILDLSVATMFTLHDL
jgi:hypothetical protein